MRTLTCSSSRILPRSCSRRSNSPAAMADSSFANTTPCDRSEERVAAVDDEDVAGMIRAGVADQIDRDAAEVLTRAPAPHGHPGQHPLREGLTVQRLLGHRRVDPAGHDAIRADAMPRQAHGEAAHHREE